MSPADSGAVDSAVMGLLSADSALISLCPGGVFYGVAAPGIQTFVLVDRADQTPDPNVFDEIASEAYIYLVKAVIPGTSASTARQAALRIRDLLSGNDSLAIDGHQLQKPIEEIQAIRIVEVDESNPDRRVQHWGGQYQITVQQV